MIVYLLVLFLIILYLFLYKKNKCDHKCINCSKCTRGEKK